MRGWIAAIALALSVPGAAQADDHGEPTARELIEAVVAAQGGEAWLRPGTLVLSGTATFYAPDGTTQRSQADDYRMWRVMDVDRAAAHSADGKVRIVAKSGERVLFEVGYDGVTTWTQDGIMPKEQADAYWANNFGFGIIRNALNEGFALERAPSRDIGGHSIDLVRITDPDGGVTMFGFDKESRFIRYLGFRTPRGWHERVYDEFIRLPESGWVQARNVTLFYDGVKANTVDWREVSVGEPIDPAVFTPPAE